MSEFRVGVEKTCHMHVAIAVKGANLTLSMSKGEEVFKMGQNIIPLLQEFFFVIYFG